MNSFPKQILTFIACLAAFVGVAWILHSSNILKTNDEVFDKVDPAYEKYISAYTAGLISSEAPIRIILAVDVKDSVNPTEPIADELFEFSPEIKGKAYWTSSNTIAFQPDKPLPNGVKYKASFKLEKVMEVVESDLKTFNFSFKTMPQNFEVETEGIAYYDKRNLSRVKVNGVFYTADVADNSLIEKSLLAHQESKSLKITWDHKSDRKTHRFTVEDVTRSKTESTVKLSWTGDALGVKNSGDTAVVIPALGVFKVLGIKVVNTPEQVVKVQFSDPLSEQQDISGLVILNDLQPVYDYYDEENNNKPTGYNTVVVGNELHIFPAKRMAGRANFTIDGNLNNILEKPLGVTVSKEIDFGKMNPAIEMKGKGVILPSTEGLILPFKAVNLKSVNMKIFKIFENNVHQFLQENELDGRGDLRRVSLPVVVKKISLVTSGASKLNRWNNFSIDLADYIKVEPGAIYRVVFNFKKEDAFVECGDSKDTPDATLSSTKKDFEEEAEDGGYYNDYEYSYDEDYDWRQRNNSCNAAFYEENASTARNVLASDLGILAKGSSSGEYVFAVNDLRTTEPLANVTVELYNFQRQLIATLTTDNNGLAKANLTKKPFLLVAKQGSQRGYLKLDDGNTLSLSNFNVAGEQVQKGLKGFIYGERGVWRPGDSLFITFILNDEQNKLPAGHPVLFEVYNPLNQLTKKIVKSTNVNHFYTFKFKTNVDAPTGNWIANVKVGSSVFTKILRIETIKPNRLKINLDFGKTVLSYKDNPLKANLKVNWLHGLSAANLKAEFEVIFARGETKFDKFPGYVFDDATKDFESKSQTILDEKLDANGLANINASIDLSGSAPGMLNAIFKGRVFEEGGDASVDRITMPYYPYPSYVGMHMPEPKNGVFETNANHTMQLAVVNEKGQLLKRDRVEVEMYKLSWRWWWEHSEDDAYYIGSSLNDPVKRETVNLVNGRANWVFNMPNSSWGRYLVRVTDPVSKHATSQVIFMDSYYGGSRAQNSNGAEWATMLSFSSNKEKYTVGEKIQLNIPSSEGGRALVSIENGTKVLKTFWVQTTAGQTNYTFEATPEMAPNVYAHVTLLQPHKNTVNDLPIRMYGIVPLFVEDPNTHLEPVLSLPKVIKPAEKVTMQVYEKQGRDMTYTIAMVDEGLLDITRFKTPNPWETFFAREALGVKTWDLYDYVCGAYGGQLNRILAVGGDGDLKNPDGTKANRFKPVVKYFGPFILKKGETQSHSFQMPNYVGSVRTMVVAGNLDGGYGNCEVTTSVRQSVMVLSSLPRVLGPDEEVLLPVTVFANEPNVKTVSVSLVLNNLFTNLGASKVNVTFSKPGEKMVYFKLKTKKAIGVGKVKVVATSGNVSIPYETEIDVRNPNNRISEVKELVLNPGQSLSTSFNPVGMSGTNKYTLEVSTMPSINLASRLDYLVSYPHGCVEQTTSSVFPQLYLNDIFDLSSSRKMEIENNIKAAIDRLQSFQTPSGGFAYWPKGQEADEWGSNYAGHFLIEAQKKGFAVPTSMIKAWKQYQNTLASSYVDVDNQQYKTNIQAYRLYVLALAGSPNLGAMNRMREQNNLTTLSKWELAAAYVTAGQFEIGKMIADKAPLTTTNYSEMAYTYGSDERDKAVMLEVLLLINDKAKAFNMAKILSQQLSSNYWMSTQTTAYALSSVAKFVNKMGSKSPINLQYVVNGKAKSLSIANKSMINEQFKINESATNTVNITNKGKGLLYVRVVGNGVPWNDKSVAGQSGLSMNVSFKNLSGEVVDVANMKQGTDFMAEVTLTNQGLRGDLKQLALTQVFAAGWEISNTRLDAKAEMMQLSKPDYIDFKDDRVLSYFDLNVGERKIFRVLLNASYVGKYYLPMFNCEAMYDNTIYARNAGRWVMVK